MPKCICPRCRKEHVRKVDWKGRGVPRIYCNQCKITVRSISNTVKIAKLPTIPHKGET